jgi:DNA excision repair protein ERCC-2
MAIRIDDKNKVIRLGVKDLVSPPIMLGSILAADYLPSRAGLGRDVHRIHQAESEKSLDSYRSEVHVKHQMNVEDYTVLIQGRIDGVYERDGMLIVEELKSVVAAQNVADRIEEANFTTAVRQLQVYMFLVAAQTSQEVAGNILFIGLQDASREILEVAFDPEEVENLIVERVIGLLADHRMEEQRLTQLKDSAQGLQFPFPEMRKYQDEMMQAVRESLEHRRDLLVSAPTGVGKTVAALFPSLRYALLNKKRLFFVTPKTTQQKIVVETLRKTIGDGGSISCICLRAKEKMCANDVFYCHPSFCPFARDYYDRLAASSAIDDLLAENVIEPETVYARAVDERLCPFELSLDVALHMTVIVCDYNYVFDPAVSLRRFFSDQRYDDIILMIDEAHNLYPRGRQYYSPVLNRTEIRSLIVQAGNLQDPLFEDIRETLQDLDDYFSRLSESGHERFERAGKFLVEIDLPFFDEEKEAIEADMARYFLYKKTHDLSLPEDPFDSFYRDFNSFYSVLQLQGDEFSYIYEAADAEHSLKILCKDPSRFLGDRIRGFYATIAMSATLIPLNFFRDVLGFDRDATRLVSFPSPFPQENRKVLVVPGISTTYRLRGRSYEQTARTIAEIVSQKKGNYFVFFSSFNYLEAVSPHLSLPGFNVIRQERSMSERQRADLLRKLTVEGYSHIVLAVQGGIFAEGVDYPGEMLIGAVIVGPGLPMYNFEQELMREYFQERYGAGFQYAYVYPGMNRVVQSAGRVIRTENDRGVIALLGKRFAHPEYYSLFPQDWYVYSPKELTCKDPAETVRQFWAETDP